MILIDRSPKRVDCSRLYELEVQRLELDLKLMKMGLGADGTTASIAAAPAAAPAGRADQGWSNGYNGKKKKKK